MSTDTFDTAPAFESLVESSLSSNLQAKWTLDAIDGGTVYDSTTNNYDGTVNGPTITSDCPHGNCLLFDAEGEDVNLGNILNTTGSITISAWVNSDSPNATDESNWIIIKMGGSGNRDWGLSQRYGGFVFYITGPTGTELYGRWNNTAYSGDEWKHVVAVYDASECIKILIKKEKMGELEAYEHYMGSVENGAESLNSPVFISD